MNQDGWKVVWKDGKEIVSNWKNKETIRKKSSAVKRLF